MEKILVWDWPVRIGHWLLVAAFAIAWLTSEGETWRLVHAYAGGTLVGVMLFRLLWGFLGSRHARFASFVRGPAAAFAYLKGLVTGQAMHTTGHNPAGGWAILLLIVLGLATGGTGWLIYNDWGGHWLEELHEGLANTMLIVVGVHIAGVIVGSLVHHENLVRAMFTGRKRGEPGEAIASARPLAAVALLGWVALCAWWLAR
ncbi:cytochrome b/b6 domain-containing protein [Sulfuricystis thermophila]|uniref:cytochrome b/b6 domain-containing protein n=1 Tax=Sulfuricystis thermophila TaxID=2496847 RepID=UPI0010369C22|nr:cytochrome b/b6 domain-containing protein [Sulfuricystis thermophila]